MRGITSSQLLRFGLAGWVFAFAAPSLACAEEPSRLDDPSRRAPILRAEGDPGQTFCGYRPPDPSIARLQQLVPDRRIDLPPPRALQAQGGQPDVGTVSTVGDLIILELDPEDLLPGNLFDLEGKTIRFTPDGAGYRTEVDSLQWDPDFGSVIDGYPAVEITLNNFEFPFSGQSWTSLFVNPYGCVTFGDTFRAFYNPFSGVPGSDRFLLFSDFAGSMVDTIPIISPLFRKFWYVYDGDADPFDVNRMYVKEVADRVVVTWDVSPPYYRPQLFTLVPLMNRFQAVLHENGTIEFSYDSITEKDGIVGLFTINPDPAEEVLATIQDPQVADYVDLLSVTASLLGTTALRFTFEAGGTIPPPGDSRIHNLFYRVWIDLDEPFMTEVDYSDAEFSWEVGSVDGGAYFTNGPGAAPGEINGNEISLTASVGGLGGAQQFAFFSDVADFGDSTVGSDVTTVTLVTLPDLPNPEIDLSVASTVDPAREIVFEAFHYADVPDVRDIACAVIGTLGDQFDFLALYTDYRDDRQESGAVSTGSIGDLVTGIMGDDFLQSAENFCSNGRLQCIQHPSYIHGPFGAREGTDFRGSFENYERQVELLSHELGHRWLTLSEALVDGEVVSISLSPGDVHWSWRLNNPTAFPIDEQLAHSVMIGNVWRDNADGTFSIVGSNVASGYSHLDLYLLGLLPAQAVPDSFIIENEVYLGVDAKGNQHYAGDRIDITIDDIIAANGPRLPAFEESQKEFNIGFVGIVEPGSEPSDALLERLAGFRQRFAFEFWPVVTGGVSTMTSVVPECPASSPAEALQIEESSGGDLVDLTSNRTIGLVAGDPGRTQCIRIRFTSLPEPFDAWNDTDLFVTEPQDICSLPGVADVAGCGAAPTFKVAGLTCDPAQGFFTDWSLVGQVHVQHPGIVPGGRYDVQVIDASCDLAGELNYSPPLAVQNSASGDISGPFDPDTSQWLAPDGVVGIPTDVLAAIAAFSNTPGNVTKLRADIEPCVLDFKVNISDIVHTLNGFMSLPYQFAPGRDDCPPDPCGG